MAQPAARSGAAPRSGAKRSGWAAAKSFLPAPRLQNNSLRRWLRLMRWATVARRFLLGKGSTPWAETVLQ